MTSAFITNLFRSMAFIKDLIGLLNTDMLKNFINNPDMDPLVQIMIDSVLYNKPGKLSKFTFTTLCLLLFYCNDWFSHNTQFRWNSKCIIRGLLMAYFVCIWFPSLCACAHDWLVEQFYSCTGLSTRQSWSSTKYHWCFFQCNCQ